MSKELLDKFLEGRGSLLAWILPLFVFIHLMTPVELSILQKILVSASALYWYFVYYVKEIQIAIDSVSPKKSLGLHYAISCITAISAVSIWLL